MTNLAANKQRDIEIGDINEFPMVASDIIFEWAAVGLVDATGHARPLTSSDKFVGFARAKADNGAGAAADIRVEVYTRGRVELPVAGAVITDVGQPVYATDDNAFQFIATSAVFVGYIWRFVSAGVAVVEYDATNFVDPYAGWRHVTVAGDNTPASVDNGTMFWFNSDGGTMTLPAIAIGVHNIRIYNAGAFGTQLMTVDLDGGDMLEGPGITAADGKGLINTKATARRGDRLDVSMVDAIGYSAENVVGTWVRET